MKDTHDEPDQLSDEDIALLGEMDAAQLLSMLEVVDHPRRLEQEWEAWVEVLRREASPEPHRCRRLARLIERYFQRRRRVDLPEVHLSYSDKVDFERERLMAEILHLRPQLNRQRAWSLACAEANRVVAERHWPGNEGNVARLCKIIQREHEALQRERDALYPDLSRDK